MFVFLPNLPTSFSLCVWLCLIMLKFYFYLFVNSHFLNIFVPFFEFILISIHDLCSFVFVFQGTAIGRKWLGSNCGPSWLQNEHFTTRAKATSTFLNTFSLSEYSLPFYLCFKSLPPLLSWYLISLSLSLRPFQSDQICRNFCRLGKIWNVWPFLEQLFSIWQKCEPTLAKKITIGKTFNVLNGQILNKGSSPLITLVSFSFSSFRAKLINAVVGIAFPTKLLRESFRLFFND